MKACFAALTILLAGTIAADFAEQTSNFDGNINDEVKSGFLNKIQEITNGEKTGWAICFIPASTKSKTQIRYKKLAEAIQASGYKVAIDAIYNEHDHEAGHLTGKTGNPIEGFYWQARRIEQNY